MNGKLVARVVWQFLMFPVVVGAALFLPAGTFDYWQAWAFAGVFFACTLAITVWMAVADPELLERRMSAGPAAEREPAQKVIMALAFVAFAGVAVVPALDRRFGWSTVPAWVAILGDVLVALSYVGFYFVFRENSYGAATIQVAEGQRVISTGPYAAVRHPMYAGALVLLFAMPLALGSWWGLVASAATVPVLAWRIVDEERFLSENLPGYTDYRQRVRYRLVPGVW
jgi:protein-S-isoprenylcysteine O-methyltransferase Ste14